MKIVQCDLSCSVRTDRPTDSLSFIMKLLVALYSFSKASINYNS